MTLFISWYCRSIILNLPYEKQETRIWTDWSSNQVLPHSINNELKRKKEFPTENKFRNMTDMTVISEKVVDANYSRILRRKILLGWHEIIILFRTWNCDLKHKYTTILKTFFEKLVSAYYYVMTITLPVINVRN